jgi:hypothetical protein
MTDASPPGWLVVVRVWNAPDECYFAMIPDRAEAEEQVREAAQITGQASVQAVRELTADEMATHGLQPGKIIYAPKSSRS